MQSSQNWLEEANVGLNSPHVCWDVPVTKRTKGGPFCEVFSQGKSQGEGLKVHPAPDNLTVLSAWKKGEIGMQQAKSIENKQATYKILRQAFKRDWSS